MLTDAEEIRPILKWGKALLVVGVFYFVFMAYPFFLNKESAVYVFGPSSKFVFLIYLFIQCFILATAIGVIYLKQWGYVLFKVLLYIMLIGFPVGTYFSYKTLSYIKQHNVKRFFGSRYLTL